MDLGVHLVNFDFPGGEAGHRPHAREGRRGGRAGRRRQPLRDGPLPPDRRGGRRRRGRADARGVHTLGYLAAHTESVELQLLVTGVTYRHPGLLAKIVSTLDVLSGGRAALGIGAAWYEREHAAYGVPFPPLKERFERLEETLQIVHQMWSSDDGPYAGRHYQLAETICSPQPLRRPRPPIMVGGAGEKKTLRLLAQYADAGNLFAGPHSSPEAGGGQARRAGGALRARGHRLPAHPQERPVGGAGRCQRAGGREFAERLAPYAAAGVTEVHVMPWDGDPVGFVEGLGAHVVPRLADLG